MSISQVISKSHAGDSNTTGSKSNDSLERQMEAAEFYGVIKADNTQSAPKKRGRPPASKSKSPARSTESNIPETFPTQSKQHQQKTNKIDEVLEKMNRTRLLTKLRAYNAYWPDICPLSSNELSSLSITDMERLIEMFELSVNSFSEIIDIPQSIKATIAKIEPIAINLAASNPDNYWLAKGRFMTGFSSLMSRDPNIDRNVKLLSIRLLGKLPRHPLFSLLYHICGIAFHVVSINEAREGIAEVNEEYKEL